MLDQLNLALWHGVASSVCMQQMNSYGVMDNEIQQVWKLGDHCVSQENTL